jgi:hypothetical protein
MERLGGHRPLAEFGPALPRTAECHYPPLPLGVAFRAEGDEAKHSTSSLVLAHFGDITTQKVIEECPDHRGGAEPGDRLAGQGAGGLAGGREG